jgi:hypothetical protein
MGASLKLGEGHDLGGLQSSSRASCVALQQSYLAGEKALLD